MYVTGRISPILMSVCVFAVCIAGCPLETASQGGSNPDSGLGAPATPSGPVVVKGTGFSVTLPDSAESYDVGVAFPGATFEASFSDALGYSYLIYTVHADSIASFSADDANSSVQFVGSAQTSSGDFIILAETPSVAEALAELADGQLLLVGTQYDNPLKNIIFASIDLAGTDGTSLEENANDGVPILVSPASDGYIALDDNTVYSVPNSSSDIRLIAGWGTGDAIMAHDASDFYSTPDVFFLTKIGEYESVAATYIGTSDQFLICPSVIDHDPLYSVTIPCGSILEVEPSSEVPTADFESYYFDNHAREFYLAVTVAPESLPVYSAPTAGSTGISIRYDGMLRTSFGDWLILATGHLQSGTQVNYAYGLLADGRMLMVGTGSGNPLASSFVASISLVGTDGSSIGTATVEGIPALLAPAPDGVVVLDDNSTYRVEGSGELQRLASWTIGSQILVHDATLISQFDPFFLTNRTEWISVEADYVGSARRSTITSLIDVQFGSVEIQLADGSEWRVAFTDEAEAESWRVGDSVATIEDSASFLGHTMLRISTGQTLIVEPN